MEITAATIKRLRDKTGAGMMDCKKALEASNGDMDAAIEFLRKKGAAMAQKRADRSAKEGVIVASVSADGKRGVMVEVNCETDFVARSDDFMGFAGTVLAALEREGKGDPDSVSALKTDTEKTVGELLSDLLAKVGEKIEVRRITVTESGNGVFCSYVHVGNKIGVLVELEGVALDEKGIEVGRNIAMQIAAMNPMVVSREEITPEMIARELEIYRTQAANEGKPAEIAEKIAKGRLEKFFQEVCLLEQTYIRDSGKIVREFLKENPAAAGPITVKGFTRLHLGEE
ncbi:MAG: translation elongation factor Ts [Ignavibacteria bacterium]|nr:translation elongation factor Ts [Ignavibacteria bacterium]